MMRPLSASYSNDWTSARSLLRRLPRSARRTLQRLRDANSPLYVRVVIGLRTALRRL